jgi:hypothetical protein
MLNFEEFRLSEAETKLTTIQKIKTQISEKFDAINNAKKTKKPGDMNSEVNSIIAQSTLYSEISAMMKTLAAEIKASGKSENIY